MEYRKNVGIVVLKNNLIFAGFRSDVPKDSSTGWQMPQGGIEDNEDILEAGYRELFEETGIKKEKIQFISQMPYSIKYDFEEKVIKKNRNTRFEKYKGQEQFWVIFNFLGNDEDVNLQTDKESYEFSHWDWKTANFMINNVYKIKKHSYTQLFTWMKKEHFLI